MRRKDKKDKAIIKKAEGLSPACGRAVPCSRCMAAGGCGRAGGCGHKHLEEANAKNDSSEKE